MAKQVSLVRLVDKRDYKVDSVKVKNICQSMDGLILFVQRYGSPISFTLAPQPAVSTISYENRVNILSQSWSPINKSYDCQFEVLQIGEVEGGEQQLHSFNSSFHICDRAYPNGAVLDLSVRQRRRHCAVWMAMKDYSGVLSVGIASDNPSRLHCSILPQAAEQPAADYEVTMKISPSSRSTGKIKVGSSSRLTLLQTGASLQETPNAPSPPPPQLKKSHSKTVPHHHLRIFTTTGTASHPSNPSSLHRRLHGVGPSPASTTNTSSSSYLIISSPTSSAGSPMLMSPVQIKQEQQHILFVAMVQLFSLLYFVEKIFGKIIAICRHIPWPVAILLSAILIAAITKYFQ